MIKFLASRFLSMFGYVIQYLWLSIFVLGLFVFSQASRAQQVENPNQANMSSNKYTNQPEFCTESRNNWLDCVEGKIRLLLIKTGARPEMRTEIFANRLPNIPIPRPDMRDFPPHSLLVNLSLSALTSEIRAVVARAVSRRNKKL